MFPLVPVDGFHPFRSGPKQWKLSNRNRWQLCSGFSGNLFPDYLETLLRNPHLNVAKTPDARERGADQVPDQTVAFHREPSLWEGYRWQILGGMSLLLLQGVSTFGRSVCITGV
jgi:hypothetical protein